MLPLMILALTVALAAVLVSVALVRYLHAAHLAELDRLTGVYRDERGRLAERLHYLEFQLANHVAHVLHLPPPAPPVGNGPKPEPLPDVMQKFLDAIDDEESRSEYEGGFRAAVALGADPATVVAEALRG